jgi:hypothetical protein
VSVYRYSGRASLSDIALAALGARPYGSDSAKPDLSSVAEHGAGAFPKGAAAKEESHSSK